MKYKKKTSEEPLPKVKMLDSKEVDKKDMEKVMTAALLMDIPVAETLEGIKEPAIKNMSRELMKGAVTAAVLELIKLGDNASSRQYSDDVVKLARLV